ncbi:MAG: phage tail protein [Saprospiraceae bacterium]|uniref:Phage tail protein n=1 Tax=Candidatus Opimibacter skivensis TaxID=2982028 RepID=A0A9D7XNE7_9BACT|nr:phage tail protein [Candidatus Opimibacter skivensis]
MDPFVAEIRIVGFNFAPHGWAFCDGQILPLSQNTALFSLLGTTYGGNGASTFALPNFQGNAPMFWGQGPGLSLRDIGETGGSETVTLLDSEMPNHTHTLMSINDIGDVNVPTGNGMARSTGASVYHAAAATSPLSPLALSPVGSSFPHNNLQPYLTLNFVIALQGVYPPRT